MIFLQALLVLISTAVADAVWMIYITASSEHKVFRAATASAAIVLIGSISLFGYLASRWMVLPAAAGAWLGSYAVLKYGNREE